MLTHWGRVTHICVSKKIVIIGSENGLAPCRCQAIIWTNAGILLIGPLGINFSYILIVIQTFPFKKMHVKMSSVKWRAFCLGLNMSTWSISWLLAMSGPLSSAMNDCNSPILENGQNIHIHLYVSLDKFNMTSFTSTVTARYQELNAFPMPQSMGGCEPHLQMSAVREMPVCQEDKTMIWEQDLSWGHCGWRRCPGVGPLNSLIVTFSCNGISDLAEVFYFF